MKYFSYSLPVFLVSGSLVSAAYNSTNDIYCKPQPTGTCTLSLHLGAHLDWMEPYLKNLADGTHDLIPGLRNRTQHQLGRHNNTKLKPSRHFRTGPLTGGYNSSVYNASSSSAGIPSVLNGTNGTDAVTTISESADGEIDVTFANGSLLETVDIQAGTDARRKRGHVRHQTARRNFNASNFLGDVALVLDHTCTPISNPINGLNDSSTLTTAAGETLDFVLYQPGSSTGHHGFNFVFAFNGTMYQDLIATEHGLLADPHHPCACMATNNLCPDGSDRCCSCKFVCNN